MCCSLIVTCYQCFFCSFSYMVEFIVAVITEKQAPLLFFSLSLSVLFFFSFSISSAGEASCDTHTQLRLYIQTSVFCLFL